jgi:RNA polymerase sigma-70 factor (ECF subfamily)
LNTFHKNDSELKQEMLQVEAAKADPARFNVLYEKYYKSIFVFIHRRTNDEDLTADITSQVFLKALINIRKYEYKGVPFSAWLFRIAFNELNMYFRKNDAARVVSIEQSSIGQMIHDAQEEDTSHAQQQMLQALKQLELEDIQIIELRFFEKRPFAEVAGIVGITESNAKVRVYRILDKLKKLLQKKI